MKLTDYVFHHRSHLRIDIDGVETDRVGVMLAFFEVRGFGVLREVGWLGMKEFVS
jgi:hypothetical protein